MDLKPKILFVSPLPPPHGGIATWTEKIFASSLADDFELLHVDTRLRGQRAIFDRARFSLAEIYRTFAIHARLFFLLIIKRPQLVHLCCALSEMGVLRDYVLLRMINLFRVPIICHYRGNLLNFKCQAHHGWSGRLLKNLINLASHNIVESHAAATLATFWCPQASISMLPNFIEDELFDYQLAIKKAPIRALFVGGVTKQKGCLEILAVAKKMSQVEFHLIGKVHQDLVSALKHASSNVIVHGVCDNQDLLKVMRASHFLFFPSHTEGFPLTVLEAMAMGLAIVSTRVGAIPEMVDAEGGILVAPNHIEELLAAVMHLISNPQLINTMGAYNKQKSFTQFSRTQVLKNLKDLYKNILQGAMPCVE